MERFLHRLLSRMLPSDVAFEVHAFQCKQELLERLPARLRGYAKWLPADWRLVVVVDRDDDACQGLKEVLEAGASDVGLRTRSSSGSSDWQIVNRIAIEELEAWYFGDWDAVRRAYPKVKATVPRQASYRDPDAVKGGTWEALERIFQRHGYFKTGLRKLEVAGEIGKHLDPGRNRSRSFAHFRDAITEAVA